MMEPNNLIYLRYSDIICDDNAFKKIAFESIFTAFIVLSIGIALAVVSLICEKFWKKPEAPKKDPAKEIGKIAKKHCIFSAFQKFPFIGKIKTIIYEIIHNPCYKVKSCKLTIEHEDTNSIDELVWVHKA